MSTSYFPDLNVWLALVSAGHSHHPSVVRWAGSLPNEATLSFCRSTQMGLLRLLTTRAVMGDLVVTLAQAWTILDGLMAEPRTHFVQEPAGTWELYRLKTDKAEVSPKIWADAYLGAFAERANLQLVTFDLALGKKIASAVLLSD